LRIKNGKITKMIAKENITKFLKTLFLLGCGGDSIIELYMKTLIKEYNAFFDFQSLDLV
jgi:predicted nucleotide-binding protein (sugar kinase/HSP70/actin superfamily)